MFSHSSSFDPAEQPTSLILLLVVLETREIIRKHYLAEFGNLADVSKNPHVISIFEKILAYFDEREKSQVFQEIEEVYYGCIESFVDIFVKEHQRSDSDYSNNIINKKELAELVTGVQLDLILMKLHFYLCNFDSYDNFNQITLTAFNENLKIIYPIQSALEEEINNIQKILDNSNQDILFFELLLKNIISELETKSYPANISFKFKVNPKISSAQSEEWGMLIEILNTMPDYNKEIAEQISLFHLAVRQDNVGEAQLAQQKIGEYANLLNSIKDKLQVLLNPYENESFDNLIKAETNFNSSAIQKYKEANDIFVSLEKVKNQNYKLSQIKTNISVTKEIKSLQGLISSFLQPYLSVLQPYITPKKPSPPLELKEIPFSLDDIISLKTQLTSRSEVSLGIQNFFEKEIKRLQSISQKNITQEEFSKSLANASFQPETYFLRKIGLAFHKVQNLVHASKDEKKGLPRQNKFSRVIAD